MSNLEKLFWFFPKSVFFEYFRNPEIKVAFKKETDYTNFLRFRTLTVVLFCISILLLILDFSSDKIWDETTLLRFKILDISLLIFLLYPLYVSLSRTPRNKNGIRKIHQITFKVSLFVMMIWIGLISANESTSSNGIPTFVIGSFVICSVFILDSFFVFSLLITGLVAMLLALLHFNFGVAQLIQQYFSSIVLVVLAYAISRILTINSIKTFLAKNELEKLNSYLDEKVHIRTKELLHANEVLQTEIAERKKSEVQLSKAKQRAEESDKLKSSFLANMSHEIRTPLNGIVGFSELMQVPIVNEDKRKKYSSIIKKESVQLLKIIDSILDISMLDTNQMKFRYSFTTIEQILSPLITKITAAFLQKESQTITFEFINELPSSDFEICTDKFRLQQVIQNLLDNAIKFTDSGTIKLIARLDGDELFIGIEDTGIGIPFDKSVVIFDRFIQADHSTSRIYGGTGLGLSISSGIIRALNGKIWLDYSTEEGARFCFSIPVSKPVRKLSASEKLKIAEKNLSNKKVLLSTSSKNEFLFFKNLFEPNEVEYLPNLDGASDINFPIIVTRNLPEHLLLSNKTDTTKTNQVFLILSGIGQANKTDIIPYPIPVNLNKFVSDVNSYLLTLEANA